MRSHAATRQRSAVCHFGTTVSWYSAVWGTARMMLLLGTVGRRTQFSVAWTALSRQKKNGLRRRHDRLRFRSAMRFPCGIHHFQAGTRLSVLPRLFAHVDTSSGTSGSFSTVSDNNLQEHNDQTLYQELKSVAIELRKHDAQYYNSLNGDDNDDNDGRILAVSDDVYDAMAAREAEICTNHPHLWKKWQVESKLGIEATRYEGRVGISSDRQKRHLVAPMLSLDNAHDTSQLLAWLERIRKRLVASNETRVTLVTEPKLDGLSLSLRYERDGDDDGLYIFRWASTRGDGTKGTDVSTAVKEMGTIPLQFQLNEVTCKVLEIRGEVVLPQSKFLELQQNEKVSDFSNARNAASGILLRIKEQLPEPDDTRKPLRSKLRFYAYDVAYDGSIDSEDSLANSMDVRNVLGGLGFLVPEPIERTTLTIDNATSADTQLWEEENVSNLLNYYRALETHRMADPVSIQQTNDTFSWGDYDMDGCVHKVSDESLRAILGSSNRAPRWAIAHKFPANTVVTQLLDITTQVGRTGAITPVAILKAVEIGGTIVKRATMHNFQHMQHLLGGVDRILRNSSVVVRRAGDVIPQVVSLVPRAISEDDTQTMNVTEYISLSTPSVCPACGSDTKFETDGNGTERNTILRCTAAQLLCQPQAVGALRHAYGRDALDLKGLSDAKISHLMAVGYMRMPNDVFSIVNDSQTLQEIEKLPGWGEKSVRNLSTTTKRVAREGVSLSRYIYSLGIPHVGRHQSSLVAKLYGNVSEFLSDVEESSKQPNGANTSTENATFIRLREDNDLTKGIGPSILSAFVVFSQSKDLVSAANKLAQSIRVLDVERGILPELPEDLKLSSHSTPFSGISVVFTGSIPNMTRSEAQRLAKSMGAKSTPASISKSTGVLVTGIKVGIKKREKATSLGIKVLEFDQFLQESIDFQKRSTDK